VPRRMERSCKSSLFSSAYRVRSCCRPVESCGTLLNLEALDSYKIIYSRMVKPARIGESRSAASAGGIMRRTQERPRAASGFSPRYLKPHSDGAARVPRQVWCAAGLDTSPDCG
jgi:hypothetical protein